MDEIPMTNQLIRKKELITKNNQLMRQTIVFCFKVFEHSLLWSGCWNCGGAGEPASAAAVAAAEPVSKI